MSKPQNRKKRKYTAIILAPALAIIFLVGWCLTIIEQSRPPKVKQPPKPIKNKPTEQDGIEFGVITSENEKEIEILTN